MASPGPASLILRFKSQHVPEQPVYVLHLCVTSGTAKYDFHVGTMGIATRGSDTVGLRDFHSCAQRSHRDWILSQDWGVRSRNM